MGSKSKKEFIHKIPPDLPLPKGGKHLFGKEGKGRFSGECIFTCESFL
jgi:hypothetical protein